MSSPTHIIKRDDARSAVPSSPFQTAFAQGEALQSDAPQSRILRSPRCRNASAPAEPPPAPEEQPRRILRGAQARLAARPVEIAADPLAPDAPLPASPDDELASEEKTSLEHEAAAAREAEWAARLEKATREAAKEAAEVARAEGYAQGYAEAETRLDEAFTAERTALLADMDHLGDLWQQHIEESAPLLTELALEIAETLLDAPLPDAVRGASVQGLTAAVEQLAGTPPVQITLHPVDYLRLQEAGITEQLEAVHDGLRWTTDATLAEGDWSVQSPEAALRRLRAEITQTVRNRLGLSEAGPDA